MKAIIYSHKRPIGETDLQVGTGPIGTLYGSFIPPKPETLAINVQLENGIFLFPHEGYKTEENRIELTGVHHKIIEDFITTNPPRPFVEEPWQALTIEQKIFFEEELRKELTSHHILSDAQVSAFCFRNDDILFEINKPGLGNQFALVHLTWTGKKEREGFPGTEFYSNFDEFKLLRMYPDKAEWEY